VLGALVATFVLVYDHFEHGSDVSIVLSTILLLVAMAEGVGIYRTRAQAERRALAEAGHAFEALAAAVQANRTKAHAEHRARQEAKRVVEALAAAVDARDHYTHYHSERVASYARLLAIELDLEPHTVQLIAVAGRLHDVGKIAVPDSILLKRGRLTAAEYEAIKQHSSEGERIVRSIGFDEIAPWIRHHHERWDGKGYPDGTRAKKAPIESRILAAADALDAMTNDRAYQPAIGLPEAVLELESNSGTQFDPKVTTALVSILSREMAGDGNGRTSGFELVPTGSTGNGNGRVAVPL
jgi:HD-GYP domain-containing protein (c-di-GMP phosphodiesterase class II)